MSGEAFGPYRLVSLLGRGGMGEVWRAVDTSQGDRTVALKVLGSWLNGDADFAGRFRRESALAARLSGPHIVPIHRYGEIGGRLYIDMPLVDGTDLAALLADHGPLPPARAVAIIDQVADALDTAHRAGMVHRDVKPSNVLVTARDHAYLIDFGIARALDGTRYSMTGSVIGTLAYMAPERFDGVGDHRGDVYALGCVLHEALTGRPPFTVEGMPAYWKAHSSAPRPRPSAVRPGLPPALDQVVATAMDPEPERRYAGTTDLAAAVKAALTGPVEPAFPVGATVRPAARTVAPGQADADVAVTTHRHRNASASPRPAPQELQRRPGPPPPSMPFPPSPPAGSPVPAPRTRRRWPWPAAVAAVALAVVVGLVVTLASAQNGTTADLGGASALERTLTSETDAVRAVTTTELDGRPVIVSAGDDRSLRVWDVATGDPIGDTFTGHTAPVLTMSIAQLDDRPVVISGSGDDDIRRWDLVTADPIGEALSGHTSSVYSVTTAQLDGRPVIVSGSGDRTIRVWDLTTGAPIGAPLTGHTGPVRAVTTAQLDGRPVIVSGSSDSTIRVWDLTTGAPIGAPLTSNTAPVNAVTTAQLDGRPVIISGSGDSTVRVWDLTTGDLIGEPLTGHTGVVYAVAADQLDGRQLVVSGSADRSIRVFDLTTGDPIGEPLTGHTRTVNAVATAQLDGRPVVVSGSDDETLRTWDPFARASG